ncbi:hypothetical protein [Turicimonas muris]|nr:hypothetical protein [Turicimonas muris]
MFKKIAAIVAGIAIAFALVCNFGITDNKSYEGGVYLHEVEQICEVDVNR